MVRTDEIGSFWYLEGFVDSSRRTWRTVIRALPLLVGRLEECDLRLFSDGVSHRQAEIFDRDGKIWLRDLDSTNGTRLNLERVEGDSELHEGDILHFADVEFRLSVYRPSEQADTTQTRSLQPSELVRRIAASSHRFREMLDREAVRPLFQPVVELDSGTIKGYELLSRGDLEGFETSPAELFSIAEGLGLETRLSRVFRRHGIERALELPGGPLVFLNTHPSELQDSAALLDSLAAYREQAPSLRLVLEIHEAATTDAGDMRSLRHHLRDLRIDLAYDDFGTGRSRLMEIAEAPPDYLKFDMRFVRNLHLAPQRRRQVLGQLLALTRSLDITAIAEGIEQAEEAAACRDIGFRYGQGYFLGYPQALPDLSAAAGSEPRPISLTGE